jgi:glyoxylase-like metal-dependent hydrolase (beta-lactamase superfamily II)
MKTQTIGDIRIDRVVDMEAPFAALDYLVPGAPPDLIAANADWLKPDFVGAGTDQLILGFQSFLVRTPRHTILVDGCIGNDKEREERPPWHRRQGPWLNNLRALGVEPEDIDIVTCTHLHADHVGWNTRKVDGRWVPTFPNARYVFARTEYEHWEAEATRLRADPAQPPLNHGSFDDSVLPVVEAGRAVLVDTDRQIEDAVWLEPAPGHTPGNVVVQVRNPRGRAVLIGDVMHTAAQLAAPEHSSRFCADPAQSAETRQRLIDAIAETDTVMLGAHIPTPTAGRVVRNGAAFRLETGAG